MIAESHTDQGLRPMASFRSRLRQLILERSLQEGRQIKQADVARATGVHWQTIQRLNNPEYKFNRIDAETLYPLMKYFNCKFEDLIEEAD